jgi:hypothetical protein
MTKLFNELKEGDTFYVLDVDELEVEEYIFVELYLYEKISSWIMSTTKRFRIDPLTVGKSEIKTKENYFYLFTSKKDALAKRKELIWEKIGELKKEIQKLQEKL